MSIPEYQGQFYISAEGISRDVITTDICRYLGNNAVLRPNMDANGKINGYWYWAYRALTDEMVRSLQEDSARWQREKDRNYKQGLSGTYEHSNSRTYHQDQTPMQVPMSVPMQSHPPQVAAPTHVKPEQERYVYDSQGNPYYDLKYKIYLPQPPPALRSEETPRVYTTEPSAVPAPPASAPTPGYWAIDPVSGKQYYVVNGRAQWAP